MKQKDKVQGFKIVLVGDPGVGKSSICMKYVQSFIFQSERHEGVVKNYNAMIKVDDFFVNLGIWYLNPSYLLQGYNLRTLAYVNADAFMIVFSIDNRQSFKNATRKWLHEVTKCCPQASVIFVGNKSDLRYSLFDESDDNVELLPKNLIQDEILQLKDYRYVECSALNCDNLTNSFIQCAKQILDDEKKHKKRKKKARLLENCNNCQII